MKTGIRSFFLTILILTSAILNPLFADDASLLPNAVQQFFDNNGNPLTKGTVTTYLPGTSTLATTWQDSTKTVSNSNPILLDGGGKAILYGDKTYRQVVKDRNGNLIWDAVTAPGGGGSTPTNVGDGNLVGTILPWSGIIAPNQYAFTYGQELSRSTYPELLAAITFTTNVVCTSASNTLTGLSDTTQIPIGAPIELASCVAAGSTVVSKTSSTVTLNNPSSVSINAAAVFFPYGNGNGSTTFNVPDLRGYVIAGRDNMGGSSAGRLTTAYFGNGTNNPDATGATGGAQTHTLAQSELPTALGVATSQVIDPGHVHPVLGRNDYTDNGPPTQNGLDGVGVTYAANTQPAFTGITVSTIIGNPVGGNAHSIVQPTITLNYVIKTTPDASSSSASGVASIGGMTGVIACGAGLNCSANTITVVSGGGGTSSSTIAIKDPVVVVTNSNIGSLSGLPTIDGVTLSDSNRILLNGQTSAVDNGIWSVAAGAWSRPLDWSTSGQAEQGTQIFVTQGTTFAHSIFTLLTSGSIIIGSTPIHFDNGRNTAGQLFISLASMGIVLNTPSAAATNDTIIAAAFAQADAMGGGTITAPCGNIYVSATIDNKYQHILFQGGGASYNSNGGTSPAMTFCTRIRPTTAITVLKHRTPYVSTSAVFAGGGFKDLMVDGNGVGLELLEIDSIKRGTYTGLTLYDAVGGSGNYAVRIKNGTSGVDLADNPSVLDANIDLVIRQLDGVSAQATGCLQITGSSNGNFNYNFGIRITCISTTSSPNPAVDIANADNNTFANLAIYNGGTGDGLRMRCATPANGDNNTFYHLFSNAPIVAEGTDTGGCSVPIANQIFALDSQGVTPTAGTGSSWLYVNNNTNSIFGATLNSPVLSGTVSGSNTIPLGIISQINSNTMLGNWSGALANISAKQMPSCPDSSGNHLNYVFGTGITCGTSGTTTSNTITIGTSIVSGGTTGRLLYDNAGVIGELVSSTTINGTICALSSSCIISTSSAIVVSSTIITGGTSGNILRNLGGTVAEYRISGTGSVAMTNSPLFTGLLSGSNTIPLGMLPLISANTVLGNWSASNSIVSMNTYPSCADSGGNHLNYVNGTGITCGSTSNTTGTTILTVGTSTVSGGTTTRVLYDNAGVLGEYSITGVGTTAMLNGSPTVSGNLTILNNTSTVGLSAGTYLRIIGADAANSTVYNLAYGGLPAITLAAAQGTQASPTTLTNGVTAGCFSLAGYNGTGFTGGTAMLCGLANGTWSTTSTPIGFEIFTVPAGSTSSKLAATFGSTGGLALGTSFANAGTGNLIAQTSVQLGSLTALTLAAGELGFSKNTDSASAPGASGAKLAFICSNTLSGSMMLIARAGTSTVSTVIVDRVGSGVTGC